MLLGLVTSSRCAPSVTAATIAYILPLCVKTFTSFPPLRNVWPVSVWPSRRARSTAVLPTELAASGATDTVTISVEVAPPCVAASLKVSIEGLLGAVKVGRCTAALLRVTVGPAVWLQEYAGVAPEETADAEPSRVTVCVAVTAWNAPASAFTAVISTIWT